MKFSLNGEWKIYDSEGEYLLRGNVPGVVQQSLFEAGYFPHPYQGINEIYFRKLENKDWIYEKSFDFQEKITAEEEIELVFEGVDTLSDVYLNEVFLGSTQNMFMEYRFNIKNVLKLGQNKIWVHIKSPVKIPKILEQNYGKLGGPEESIRGYIRKAQYSYGWDWGIRLPTSGIFKPVYLEKYSHFRLSDCTAYLLSYDRQGALIAVQGFLKGNTQGALNAFSVEVLVNGEKKGEFKPFTKDQETQFSGIINEKEVHLWYPRGLGKPHLYHFAFILKKEGQEIYREEKKIGLRTVKLVREKDSQGESFIFEINGKRVFAKGANWIPAEHILPSLREEDYRKLLRMAYQANINMLRVWGGGIYEHEVFYSTCDELGIMVWQDFMFACLEYPDHLPWFRELCNQEIKSIVRRLRWHPAIVIWCGNNENNWGFEEWGTMNRKVDGINLGNRLYLFDFPAICSQEDPTRPYWPGSPYGEDRANSTHSGDHHAWEVWSKWQNYEYYTQNDGRFISEFGFQAFPHRKTVDFFATKKEQDIFHPVIMAHQKQEEGMERIVRFIASQFGLIKDFDAIFYLSQINQAEAIKFGVEHWRLRKYLTSGTLFWQLNDSWPVISWSAIDYFGRPKALYYYAKRFFAEILPLIKYHKASRRAEIFVISDYQELLPATVEFSVFTTSGDQVIHREYRITLPRDGVLPVDEFEVDEPQKWIAFLRVNVKDNTYSNYKTFAPYRDMKLEDPGISFVHQNGILQLTSGKNPALGVEIITEDDELLSDNFIFLEPGESKVIPVKSKIHTIKSMYDYLNG